MKKVLLYIDMMDRSGAQRVMGNLADHFVALGHRVILVNDYPQKKEVPVYPLSERVERVYLRQKLEGNPIVKNVERILRLRRLILKERPDVVLSFLGRPNLRMLIASMGISVPRFVSVRNDPNREYGVGGFKKLLARKLFNLADGCIFQTQDAAAYFEEKTREKSCVIPNPVADKFYQVERAERVSDIVTMGRLEPQKNHRLLEEAFADIAEEFPDEKLIIYGDGPMKDELLQYAAQLGMEDRILFPGNIENVPERLADTKLFVLSSDYEGMPNALMEALAVGVPCISTDCPCGGPRMLMEDHRHGLLVPVGQREKLAAALREMLSDDALREKLGQQAKEHALSFQPDLIYRKWDSFLGL